MLETETISIMKYCSLLCTLVLICTTTTLFGQRLSGKASYYADRFHGRPTSTGETYNKDGYTAASKEFPVGTVLRVRNVANNKVTQVRINDCGPNHPERIIDLSRAAAEQIDLLRAGVAMVELEVLSLGTEGLACNRSQQTNSRVGASPAPVVSQATIGTPAPTSSVAVPADRAIVPQDPNASLPTGTDEVFPLFGVQVAAYGKAANADAFITANGSKLGYLFKRTDAKLTRVFAGPFLNRNDAQAKLAELAKLNIKGIVRRVQ